MNNRFGVLARDGWIAAQKLFERAAFEMVEEGFDGNAGAAENGGAPHDVRVDGDEVFETGEVHDFKARESGPARKFCWQLQSVSSVHLRAAVS